MSSTIKSRTAAMIIAAMIALLITVIGCGTDDEDRAEEYLGRARRESRPAPPVEQPPAPESETAQIAAAPAQPAVVKPEPPKEVTYDEAEAAYHDRRYEEAVELFTRYTRRKSENPWGYYMLGLSAWKAGEYESAEDALKRALELDPRHVKSWINLGRVLLDAGRPEEALEKIDSALVIDPELDVAHRLKGRVYHQLSRNDEAVDAYRRAIQLDNNDAWSMNNMALILIEQEYFDEALPPLARAVELRNDVAIFQNNLGMALEHTGHIRAAEDAYTAAVEIDESYAKAYANMVRIEEVKEDPGLEPVDLAAIAQGFAEEVEGWRVAATDTMPPAPHPDETQPVEPDSIAVDDTEIAVADSVVSDQE